SDTADSWRKRFSKTGKPGVSCISRCSRDLVSPRHRSKSLLECKDTSNGSGILMLLHRLVPAPLSGTKYWVAPPVVRWTIPWSPTVKGAPLPRPTDHVSLTPLAVDSRTGVPGWMSYAVG